MDLDESSHRWTDTAQHFARTESSADEDFCRVCRSEGTDTDPLFHPCKCSGSIRYVHQECLLEWLKHSQKKHCELCKTPFQFTNLYDPAMPKQVPLHALLQRMAIDTKSGLLLALRWLFVGFVWLCWLPYCTRHIWRSILQLSDHITSNASGHLHDLASAQSSEVGNLNLTDVNLVSDEQETITTFLPYAMSSFTASDAVNKLLVEVFEGQIIASIIIVAFVIVFLIREWIVQNNAELLVESSEFLGTNRVQPDEERRMRMQLAAGPPAEARDPALNNTEDFHRLVEALEARVDAQDARTDLNEDSTSQGSGTFSYEGSSLPDNSSEGMDTSDWNNLRAQATQNIRRRLPPDEVPSSVMDLQDQRLDNPEHSTGSEEQRVPPAFEEDSLTVAEMKAMRRRAVLRATSERLRQNAALHDAANNQGTPAVLASDVLVDIPSHASVQDFDDRLARNEGQFDGSYARRNYRRQRSTERRIWEEAQEWAGEDYPDSPMPEPRQDLPLVELEPLNLPQAEVQESGMSSAGTSMLANEDIANEQDSTNTASEPVVSPPPFEQNGRCLPSPEMSNSSPRASRQRIRASVALSTDQLEQLLVQVRQAVTPLERNQVARAAIQVCIDIAQLLRPDLPLNDENPAYLEVREQVNSIIRVANECGLAEEIDIGQLLTTTDGQAEAQVGPETDVAETGNIPNRALDHAANPIEQLVAVEEHADRDVEHAGLDDDIEGLLEVIGVRGPFIALLQNSMLVVVAVAGFITTQVWLPHFFGQCIMAVLKSPKFYFYLLPLNICRLLLQETTRFFEITGRGSRLLLSPIIEHSRVYRYSAWLLSYTWQHLSTKLAEIYQWHDLQLWQSLPISRISQKCHELVSNQTIIPVAFSQFKDYPVHTSSRLINIICGYVGLISIGLLYLRLNIRMTSGEQGKRLELAFRSFLRQAGFITKFIVILGIELIVFPFYCGVLLDGVFLPLFKHASLAGRLTFATKFPFTSLFLHWLVGTIYMFNFALFVSMCREIVRPGLLFFIRDPNDPAFNPIKDILERPVRGQMRKIGVSVMIYGALIVGAMGSIMWLIVRSAEGLLPLSFGTTEATLEIPFDLLFFQVLLPLTYRYVKPHRKIKSIWTQWFNSVSRILRLSSFMMGERDTAQEGRLRGSTTSWLKMSTAGDQLTFVKDGTYRRVPAVDNLPMRKDKDMIMLVTEDNVLVNGADDDETKDDADYTMVYAPPYFKLRIYVFLFMMWLFAAAISIACTIPPLIFGRKIFKLVSASSQTNDIFAYLYGVYALGFAIWFLDTTTKAGTAGMNYKHIFRGGLSDSLVSSNTLKMWLQTVSTWIYLIFSFSIVMPALLGIVLESYIIIPMGIWFNPEFVPTIHMMHDWIVGLVYVKIIGRVATMLPMSYVGRSLNEIIHNDWRNGWRHPDWRLATRRLILPVFTILSAALTVPLSVGVIARGTVYRSATKEFSTLIYCMSYPAALLSGLLILMIKAFIYFFVQWRSKIRDSLYLKGRRLHNFGEAEVKPRLESDSEQFHQDDAEVELVLQELLDRVDDITVL